MPKTLLDCLLRVFLWRARFNLRLDSFRASVKIAQVETLVGRVESLLPNH